MCVCVRARLRACACVCVHLSLRVHLSLSVCVLVLVSWLVFFFQLYTRADDVFRVGCQIPTLTPVGSFSPPQIKTALHNLTDLQAQAAGEFAVATSVSNSISAIASLITNLESTNAAQSALLARINTTLEEVGGSWLGSSGVGGGREGGDAGWGWMAL